MRRSTVFSVVFAALAFATAAQAGYVLHEGKRAWQLPDGRLLPETSLRKPSGGEDASADAQCVKTYRAVFKPAEFPYGQSITTYLGGEGAVDTPMVPVATLSRGGAAALQAISNWRYRFPHLASCMNLELSLLSLRGGLQDRGNLGLEFIRLKIAAADPKDAAATAREALEAIARWSSDPLVGERTRAPATGYKLTRQYLQAAQAAWKKGQKAPKPPAALRTSQGEPLRAEPKAPARRGGVAKKL